MTEVSITAKPPDDLFKELEVFMREESLEKSVSVRKLLVDGLCHWKEKRALKSLEDGKVSFLKAVEMAGLSVWDFSDLVRDKGIVWVKSGKFIRSDIDGAEMRNI